jgi:hypothetical protein
MRSLDKPAPLNAYQTDRHIVPIIKLDHMEFTQSVGWVGIYPLQCQSLDRLVNCLGPESAQIVEFVGSAISLESEH